MVHNFFEKHHLEHQEIWMALTQAVGASLPLPHRVEGDPSGQPQTNVSLYWEAELPRAVVVQFKLTFYSGELGLHSRVVPSTAQFEYKYALIDCLDMPFHYSAAVITLGDPAPEYWVRQLRSESEQIMSVLTEPVWATAEFWELLRQWELHL